MQRTKTVIFWNEHHQRKSNQEWIVNPSSNSLLQIVLPLLLPFLNNTCNDDDQNEKNGKEMILLEIGCGTSQLGKEIYTLIDKRGKFIITDISPICIQTNKIRDEQLILESNGNFDYKVLDAASCDDMSLDAEQFHLILDKGMNSE